MTKTLAPYSLPDLPYAPDALQPIISARTMELHHGTHHAAYVKAANEISSKLTDLEVDADPSALLRALAFNVSGHVLHSLFWTSMTPGGSTPSAALDNAIVASFGSISALEKRMSATIAKLSGSGWAVLAWEPNACQLVISQGHDHQSELIVGTSPLLVIDGWEHAYYLDYTSEKAKWADKFFEVADWTSASDRFDAARDLIGVTR